MANIRQYRYPFNLYHLSIRLILVLTFAAQYTTARLDILPDVCDSFVCPPFENIICPEDSQVRETFNPPDVNFSEATTSVPLGEVYNASQYDEDIYIHCCLAKKCICKTCYIPDCYGKNEVLIEMLPESMEKPGQCCGQYECHPEPNCTEAHDTDKYWLTSCQRCHCFAGSRICHQSCDEVKKPATGICSSKSLNKYFEHGEVWRDGCYDCECDHGEEKCVLPFCRNVDCPHGYKPKTVDSCCPECNAPDNDNNYDVSENGYDEDSDEPISSIPNQGSDDIEPLPPVQLDSKEIQSGKNNEYLVTEKPDLFSRNVNTTTTTEDSSASSEDPSIVSSQPSSSSTTTSTTTTTTTSESPLVADNNDPRHKDDANENEMSTSGSTTVMNPAIFNEKTVQPCKSNQVYPEVVEVVHKNPNFSLYCVIIILLILVFVLFVWNWQLRTKQRSYAPVSPSDDNFNTKASNIKKTSDYV